MVDLSPLDATMLLYDWRRWWARPEQLHPDDARWRSWSAITGRRWGKTAANAHYVHGEAISGRAMRIGLCAQSQDETRDVMVDGDSGIIEAAPPWERPTMVRGRLVWPNGAQAFLHSAETPDAMRGPGFHLVWLTEVIAWRRSRLDEAWSNMRIMSSLGYGRTVIDSTPRRRHPIVRKILERHERAPERHVVVRGRIADNVANLDPDVVEEMIHDWGGTTRGREELDGEYLDDSEASLIQQAWIDDHRREMPSRFARRVLAIDPAISTRRSTDATGMVECGLGIDGQLYAIEDLSDHYQWEVWGEIAVDKWLTHHLDCIVVERNRGGDAVVANLRSCGRQRTPPLEVVVLDAKAKTRHDARVISVKEVQARSSKDTRLEPCAPLYQKGRVSHVRGADLEELEEQLTTWEPGDPSPNAMDAHVWALWELADLAREIKDGKRAMAGLGQVRRALNEGPRRSPVIGGLLPRGSGRTSRL